MVIFVENRHDIQGICFLLITISISEKDVPFAWTPPLPLSPFVPFWLTPSPPDLGRPFLMAPMGILLQAYIHNKGGSFRSPEKGCSLSIL